MHDIAGFVYRPISVPGHSKAFTAGGRADRRDQRRAKIITGEYGSGIRAATVVAGRNAEFPVGAVFHIGVGPGGTCYLGPQLPCAAVHSSFNAKIVLVGRIIGPVKSNIMGSAVIRRSREAGRRRRNALIISGKGS